MSKGNIFSLIAILLVLMVMIGKEYWDGKKLEKDYYYTIACVTGFNSGKGGIEIKYEYCVNGNKFSGSTLNTFSKTERLKLRGRCFIVKFNPKDPMISLIYFNREVRNDIPMEDVPIEGWRKVPSSILH